MRKIFYIALLLFCTNSIVGQNKLTNAVYSLKNGELDKAKELIDAAAEDSAFIGKPATWYYRGFIYKALFKRDEASNINSQLREKSINYFAIAYEMEEASPFSKGCENAIKYFAQTFYNQSATSFNPNDYLIAVSSYGRYKELTRKINPETDFKEKDIQFNLAMGSTFNRIATIDSSQADINMDKSIEYYKKVLSVDSNNFSANYNLGIIYYNKGVEIVEKMDYGLDLDGLIKMQDELFDIFRTSLPYMKKAYDLDPRRRETLIGLEGIYFSMNDDEKSELFKKKIQELDGE
ncbi:tetratricopeptide repeat protein [Vicingaceae bacterium]|nr:tetratricopeptide repeat protein [Vicingaceae bacterium]MDB4061290.1 tetratricopeptide repeat protein [Vicingaceae bacterium]MDC1451904.1 tetratricopeptide repeat protein [Vicingaceae bacterium]